jgi:hypothetical protein
MGKRLRGTFPGYLTKSMEVTARTDNYFNLNSIYNNNDDHLYSYTVPIP